MNVVAKQLFQGPDWQTSNSAAAEIYATLDELEALCLSSLPHLMNSTELPTEPMDPRQRRAMIADMAEVLRSEIEFFCAEISVLLQRQPPLRWVAQELRLLAPSVRQFAYDDEASLSTDDLTQESWVLADLTGRMKALIQKLDQE